MAAIIRERKLAFVLVAATVLALQSFFKEYLLPDNAGILSVAGYYGIRFALLWFSVGPALSIKMIGSGRALVESDKQGASQTDPLLLVRALAGLNVLFGHWFLVVFADSKPPTGAIDQAILNFFSLSPWCGVWMFFTLSGYLIGKGFVSKRHSITFSGYQKYVNNRVLRIWPIYFFALLIAFVFIKPSSLNLASLSNLSSMLATVSFDQKNDGVIGALWSVSTEFQFYLIAPGLYLLVERFSPRGGWLKYLVICLTLCGGMLRFIQLQNDPASWHSMVYYPLLGNLDLFLVGMFAAIFVNMKKQSGIKNGRLLFQLGLIVLIFSQVIFSSWSIPEMISFEGFPGSPTRPYFLAFAPSITSLLTAVVIALFELGKSEVKMVDGFWKTSSRIGILTYCVYVFHEPIYMGLRTIWIGNPSPVEALRFFPVGIGLVYLVSLIMYRYIEIPFDRQRK